MQRPDKGKQWAQVHTDLFWQMFRGFERLGIMGLKDRLEFAEHANKLQPGTLEGLTAMTTEQVRNTAAECTAILENGRGGQTA